MGTTPHAKGNAARSVVRLVFASGLVQGTVMVAFAASSAVLRARHGFTDAQYGSLFVPQMTLAALGAIGSSALARVLSLPRMLELSFLLMALSQAALFGSHFLSPGLAFAVVLGGTSLVGLGSGLSAAPLNTYPQTLFPGRRDTAVVAMHTAMGIGLTAGPLLVSATVALGVWLCFPACLLAICLGLLVVTGRVGLPAAPVPATPGAGPVTSPAFWLFAAITFLYAIAESTYSNWAVIYLSEEKGLSVATASLGLAAFWAALCAGRIVVGALVIRLPAEHFIVVLPLLMAGASLLLPGANTAGRGLALFGLAGLGCSAFYPLTIGLASRRFPDHVAWVTAMTFAALVAGIGVGSFLVGVLRAQMDLAHLYSWSAACPLLALCLTRWAKRPAPQG